MLLFSITKVVGLIDMPSLLGRACHIHNHTKLYITAHFFQVEAAMS
jgi:hypothetical protein